MDFETQAQEDLHARVGRHLQTAFGELAEPIDGEAAFRLDIGRIAMLIDIDANGPEKASVLIYLTVADGLPFTADVAAFLLHKNHEIPFGAFSLQQDDTIVLKELILGEAATKENLATVLQVIAADADEIQDELNMRFR